MAGLTRTAAAATPLVSTSDAKAHLRVTSSADDALITRLVTLATARVETLTGRRFGSQTWQWALDAFPADGVLVLPIGPLVSVTSVTVTSAAGVATAVPATDYYVDLFGGVIALVDGATWPTDLRARSAIVVVFVVGHATTDQAYALAHQAVLELVAHHYEHRGDDPVSLPGWPDSALAVVQPLLPGGPA